MSFLFNNFERAKLFILRKMSPEHHCALFRGGRKRVRCCILTPCGGGKPSGTTERSLQLPKEWAGTFNNSLLERRWVAVAFKSERSELKCRDSRYAALAAIYMPRSGEIFTAEGHIIMGKRVQVRWRKCTQVVPPVCVQFHVSSSNGLLKLIGRRAAELAGSPLRHRGR